MNRIVGIDLGTTNSLVATVDSGIPLVIADAEGHRLTPSVVHVPGPGETPVIGEKANRVRVIKPAETVYSVKRFMGRRGAEIERANLQAADAIVVVSQALKDELVERGLSADKILVNPNGVDASRFDPDLIHDKSRKLRKTLGLEDKIVVGFIATFGRWHGAEILARAIRPVIEKDPRIHFLFIGDGATVAAVRNIVRDTHATAATTFTGMIHQKDGPLYLGACDMFVCPHIPNPDGTPFFGSPIKLFEYMAMARGIVASRLDQIAQVLKHRTTALLVTPGSVAELVDGILELAAKPDERTRLGSNARQEVVARYTWVGHTARILDHVRDVLRRNNGL